MPETHLRFRLLALALLMVAAFLPAGAAETLKLTSCSDCWPLTSAHPSSSMVPDGAGGAFITWIEAGPRVRLLRVNADLTPAMGWLAEGLIVGIDTKETKNHSPVLAADGTGGVYIAWVEISHFETCVRALRVNGDRSPASGWPVFGIVLSPIGDFVGYPAIASLGDEGVAVAWIGGNYREGKTVRVQKVGPAGVPPLWAAGGVVVGGGSWYNEIVEVVGDGKGGVYALWTEARDLFSDVKYCALSSAGTAVWGTWGTMIARAAVPPHATMLERHPHIVANGWGGAFVLWTDETSARDSLASDLTDVLGGHLMSGASHVFPIAVGPGYQMDAEATSDGAGGCFVSWAEMGPMRAEAGRLVHLNNIHRARPGWPAGGLVLGKVAPLVVSDGAGGALAVSNDGESFVAYRLRGDGRMAAGWPEDGLKLAPASGKGNLRIAADARGGAFLAWEERVGGRVDVTLRHIGGGTVMAAAPVAPVAPRLAFAVHRPYPNPARSHCRIAFDLPTPGVVSVHIFDVMGRRVGSLAERRSFEAGPQVLEWDLRDRSGRRVAPGLYFARVVSGRSRGVARLMVVE